MPMPYDRNVDYSVLYAMIAVLVIICMSIVSKTVVEPKMNEMAQNLELQEIETAFNVVQHPDHTMRVELKKAIGLLTDQSEKCDIFVGEARSYDGERDRILAAYAGQTVEGYGEPGVIFIEDKAIPAVDKPDLPNTLNSLSQWSIDPASLKNPLYIVYIFLPEYDATTKVECR